MTRSNTLEILMFTNTSFSGRQLCELNAQERNGNLTPAEELEAACWNGLLDEMLPEITQRQAYNDKLFIWQVETRKSYLRISMGVCPLIPAVRFTLDPHILLLKKELN